MPGVVGLITKSEHAAACLQLDRMVKSMCHEDFYLVKKWINEKLGLYVGCVDHDSSHISAMPLKNETGSKVLILSGEEFPEAGTSLRLKQRGHNFDMEGCSYLVHLAEEDTCFPAGLNGQFHGVLADCDQGTVTLFNDRYGLRRLYCHQSKDAFYFAAEAKAILAVRRELRSLNMRGLGEWIALGCVLENRTVFDGIDVLPCASAWVFRGGELKKRGKYFSPEEWENQSILDPEKFYERIRNQFSRNLPRYFDGRQKIGMSLTGGLDTRMILAWRKPERESLPCYTFGGMLRESRDVKIARRVAEACGLSHKVLELGADYLSKFSYYAERSVYLTEGAAGVNWSYDLYLNQMARQIAPVRMTGNYGDQMLRHLVDFKPAVPSPEVYENELSKQCLAAGATYARNASVHALTWAAFKQIPWSCYGLLALESTQVAVRTPYMDNDLVRLMYRAPQSILCNNNMRTRLIGDGDRQLLKIRTDLGYGGRGGKLAEIMNSQYQRLTFRCEYAFDYGMPQRLAKVNHKIPLCRMEKLFLGRHKFAHFRVWYRDALANYVREMLLDSRSLARSYIRRGTVEIIVRGHLRGDENHTRTIHQLLTLEYLHRLFIDHQ